MDEFSLTPATSGKGAAAVIAVAVGSLALGIVSLAGDASPAVATMLDIWIPTGPLSGVTALAIVIWLATWWVLARRWAAREVRFKRVNWAAAGMIVVGLLLTFPPFMDLLQGK